MQRREAWLAVVLCACVPSSDKPADTKKVTPHWDHVDGAAHVRLEPVDPRAVASPEALRHHLKIEAPIASREAINDGFIATFASNGGHDVFVIRQLGREWYSCVARAVDDSVRAQAITLCKSLKRPR